MALPSVTAARAVATNSVNEKLSVRKVLRVFERRYRNPSHY